MVEQKIEKIIIDKFAAALEAANVEGLQIIGAWQTAAAVKALEEAYVRGYLSVKVQPRAFQTYTVSDGELTVRVELNIKAELDAKGVDYLTITNILTNVLAAWHKSYAVGKADFELEDEFLFTGFRLDGGDCGIDRDHNTWTWMQGFTIQGIFDTNK